MQRLLRPTLCLCLAGGAPILAQKAGAPPGSDHDHPHPVAPGTPDSGQVAEVPTAPDPDEFTLDDISFSLLFAVGGSTERDSVLDRLFAGGHDPRKRGITIQNAELSLSGGVDRYFRGDLFLVTFIEPIEGETVVEVEEAFLTTTSLPAGLELEAGQFSTEFGRHNPRHPHQWDFLAAPVIHSRVFGADGMRGAGLRLGWKAPLSWSSLLHLGVQNAQGETMASFLSNGGTFDERGVGGRPFNPREVRSPSDMVWLTRWVNGFELNPSTSVELGLSGLFGPNAGGAATRTQVLGVDFVVAWNDDEDGHQGGAVVWESELVSRSYTTDGFVDLGDPLDPADDVAVPGETLSDFGLYSAAMVQLDASWRAGLRYEYASARGASFDRTTRALGSHDLDPFRDERHRLAPALEWSPSHRSRILLQYTYDHAASLPGGEAHSVWLGFEIGLGADHDHAH